MNIDTSRPITNHAAMVPLRPGHRVRTGTDHVRVSIDGEARSGLWWPRTCDYAAEIYDLAYTCGLAVGESIERITFAWNAESTLRLLTLRPDGLAIGEAEYDQPREELRLYPTTGDPVRLTVVPPPRSGPGAHLAFPPTAG